MISKCQTVLENADTPDVLIAVVDVISFIVKNHPHCFRPHFRVSVCIACYNVISLNNSCICYCLLIFDLLYRI